MKINLTKPIIFMLLHIATFGLYSTWWIYKSWRFLNEKDNLTVNPALKTLLSIFYLIPLLSRIKKYSKSKNRAKTFSPILIVFWIFCYAVFNLFTRFLLDVIYTLIHLFNPSAQVFEFCN